MIAAPSAAKSRAILWMATSLALFATACSVENSLSVPDCATGGSVFIVAQSVPDR